MFHALHSLLHMFSTLHLVAHKHSNRNERTRIFYRTARVPVARWRAQLTGPVKQHDTGWFCRMPAYTINKTGAACCGTPSSSDCRIAHTETCDERPDASKLRRKYVYREMQCRKAPSRLSSRPTNYHSSQPIPTSGIRQAVTAVQGHTVRSLWHHAVS